MGYQRTMDEIEEAIVKTKKLLSTPSKWTKHDMAVDANGNWIHPLHNDAVAFCLIGAITRVVSGAKYDPGVVELPMIEDEYFVSDTLSVFRMANFDRMGEDRAASALNDDEDFTYDDLMECLDRTIDYVKSQKVKYCK